MDALKQLQDWYLQECNGDWEHSYEITIETPDNPGWLVSIDLTETSLHGKEFEVYSYGINTEAYESETEWVNCKVAEGRFVGAAGPLKLQEIIEIFLAWAAA